MTPIIELQKICKDFGSGDIKTTILKEVSLKIYPGEFVAIIGPSGSGKSTLMNIIGCLDQATRGEYLFYGRPIMDFSKDELSELRRDTFGFVFQRYNLINQLTAVENAEIPATYKGLKSSERRRKAVNILKRLGLGERLDHKPNQLSGGQQQRVSVARALINEGDVIVADEPTGALDSKSGTELMELLKKLNRDEHKTIIIVTHDKSIAVQAERVIEIKDGKLTSDSGVGYLERRFSKEALKLNSRQGTQHGEHTKVSTTQRLDTHARRAVRQSVEVTVTKQRQLQVTKHNLERAHSAQVLADKFWENSMMALKALSSNKLRTFLTLLGIIIGVAAVIVLLAFGEGSKRKIMNELEEMGLKTTLIFVRAGRPNARGSRVNTLKSSDAAAIAELEGVVEAAQLSSGSATIRYGNADSSTSIYGITPNYMQVNSKTIELGSNFTEQDIQRYASVAIIGKTVQENLFGNRTQNVLGKVFMIGSVPFEIIGVMEGKGMSNGGMDQDDMIYIPVTTANKKLFGRDYINQVRIEIAEEDVPNTAAIIAKVKDLLLARHRTEDFRIIDVGEMVASIQATQDTLKILLGCVAAISVLVGGIGVMNIMLVNVVERTREIGIRMSAGAKLADIKWQFLVETIIVCLIGNIVGILLSLIVGTAGTKFGVTAIFDPAPFILSFFFCIAIGIIFGYFPATKAANLEPVVALGTE